MSLITNEFYHIYNQGNNKETIFFNRGNYLYFLNRIRQKVLPVCDIISYCLMPNHFHFLVYLNDSSIELRKVGSFNIPVIKDGFRQVQSSYAKAINSNKNRSGSLFRSKIKYKMVQNDPTYLMALFNYIHQNPLRAGLVDKMEDWEFSSFRDYAGFRNGSLCNKKLTADFIDLNLGTFISDSYGMIEWSKVKDMF